MRPTIISVLFVVLVVGLHSSTSVFADQVYHSERLDLAVTEDGAAAGHPELRKGQVVNIHPNGPVNGAHERYMIVGAMPNTSYQVEIQVFESCGGDFMFPIPTVTVDTDKHGKGRAKATFSAEDLAGFSGLTIGAQWHLIADGVAAYATECTTVTID